MQPQLDFLSYKVTSHGSTADPTNEKSCRVVVSYIQKRYANVPRSYQLTQPIYPEYRKVWSGAVPAQREGLRARSEFDGRARILRLVTTADFTSASFTQFRLGE